MYTLATILALSAVLVSAQGPHHGGGDFMKKDLTCPAAGGTAVINHACHTGPPPSGTASHPHSRPTGDLAATGAPRTRSHGDFDGTITVYPTDAPIVYKTPGIDCQGCSFVVFASATCSEEPHSGVEGMHSRTEDASLPTVTAAAGATKTELAKGVATCKPADATTSA